MQETKLCVVCGKEYVPTRSDAKTCSRECSLVHKARTASEKSHQKQKAARMAMLAIPIPCPQCGKEFVRRRKNQKYCCNACTNQAAKPKKKEKPIYIRKCKVCGKEFETHLYNKATCSQDCSKSHQRSLFKKNSEARRARSAELSVEQMHEVVYAQTYLAPGDLYEAAKRWTKKQHLFARKRYCAHYRISGVSRDGF